MTLAQTLESFAEKHGLETPDTTAVREAEARFDALLESARKQFSSSREARDAAATPCASIAAQQAAGHSSKGDEQ